MKAQRIRDLLSTGRGVDEVADLVGCLPAYVRVVRLRAQGDGGLCLADRNYRTRHADQYRENERRRQAARRRRIREQQAAAP